MPVNPLASAYPNINAPLVDPKTGIITVPWQMFLRALWQRSGASSGLITVGGDLTGSLPDPLIAALAVGTAKLANNAVTFAKFQQISNARVLGNNSGAAGNVEELTASEVLDLLGSTRGQVLRREAGAWAALALGAQGLPLGSDGVDAAYLSTLGASGAGLTEIFFGTGTTGLDDYEEGTFTPTLIGSTTAGTQTYTTQLGRYVKIGNLVNCWGRVTISAKDAAMAGNALIGGLPFTAVNVAGLNLPGGLSIASNITFTAGYSQFGAEVQANDVTAILRQMGSNVATAAIGVTAVAATASLGFAFSYRTV